jgi:hypothetical protein
MGLQLTAADRPKSAQARAGRAVHPADLHSLGGGERLEPSASALRIQTGLSLTWMSTNKSS